MLCHLLHEDVRRLLRANGEFFANDLQGISLVEVDPVDGRGGLDLYQVRLDMVVLALHHAGPHAHVPDLSAGQGALVAHAVRVCQLAIDHVSNDLPVLIRRVPNPVPGSEEVIVDDSQDPRVGIDGVVVTREGEVESTALPSEVPGSRILALDRPQHGRSPSALRPPRRISRG